MKNVEGKKEGKKKLPDSETGVSFFSFTKYERYRQRTKLTKSEETVIVMNSGLTPYKRRFRYDDEESTDFYSYEACSYEILGII